VLAAAGVVTAGALGLYVGTRGATDRPGVPTRWRNSILEQATTRGIISGYRLSNVAPGSSVIYEADDGAFEVAYFGCVGDASCPAQETVLRLGSRAGMTEKARALFDIARSQHPYMKIKFNGALYVRGDPRPCTTHASWENC